jgi:hypothetical protein
MYATIVSGHVVYLGDCRLQAEKITDSNSLPQVFEVHSLEDLQRVMQPEISFKEKARQHFNQAFQDVVENFDKIGVNKEFFDNIQSKSVTLIEEAKSLSVRGMKAVGEGFIALGKLMHQEGEKEDENKPHRSEF